MLRDNRTERRGAVLRAFRGDSAGRGAVPYFPRPRIAKCVSELGFRKMFQTNVDIHKRELSRRGNMRGFWKCASVVASEACINIAFLFLDFCAFRICNKSVTISVKPNFASKSKRLRRVEGQKHRLFSASLFVGEGSFWKTVNLQKL